MSSVSGIRLPGLATGMDTEAMVKEMLTGDQNKIDKVKQKEQTIKWQQEIYREVIKDVQGLNDKYFSVTSKNSIVNSSAWNTLLVSSSNSSVITATGTAGANNVNYKFNVAKLAQPPKFSVGGNINVNGTDVKIEKDTELKSLGLDGEKTFMISYGEGENEKSKPITIRTEPTYKKGEGKITNKDGKFFDENGKEVDKDGNLLDEKGEKIIKEPADTIESLAKKINDASGGEVKASFSQMTGELTIESSKTGTNSSLQIVESEIGVDGKEVINPSDALKFLGMDGSKKIGENSEIEVTTVDGKTTIKTLNEESNSFTIDGVKYNVHSTGSSEITSKQDTQPVVDNMKAFVEDYNKLMDKMYDLITQKTNKDYPPLTEAQKKDMSEEEIKRWEEKAKKGLLKNDSEMRRFMDDMQKSIFGDNIQILNEMGVTSHSDYNKKGQIALDVDKFTKALETNADKVYEVFAKDSSSVMERMKSTIKNYTGGSSSVFAKKAGIDKTASAAKNFYSEQLKRQADTLKTLQRKMGDKENALYKKFGALEASMNKLNSQMNYFAQM